MLPCLPAALTVLIFLRTGGRTNSGAKGEAVDFAAAAAAGVVVVVVVVVAVVVGDDDAGGGDDDVAVVVDVD